MARYCADWKPDELPSDDRKPSYSEGVSVSSTAHCSNNCFWINFTRDRILKQASSWSTRTKRMAALSSCSISFIHSSETWCWMMNSISSCRGAPDGVPESGRCDESNVSRCRYPAYVSRSLKSVTMPGSSGCFDMAGKEIAMEEYRNRVAVCPPGSKPRRGTVVRRLRFCLRLRYDFAQVEI